MGHMFEQAEIDIMVRWRRMTGRRALWVPGTDHAGIATQLMVERQLATEGTSRQQLGREAFEARVWEWKRHYGGAILDQMKRLGASVDWQREYFTMDDHLSVAVREAFVRLYEQGLIYRGAYIVNWCPRCQTAISDLEVVYDEHKGHLWEIRYPVLGADGRDTGEFLTVATTRPETMLGDVAVAIHPADERYLHLHGSKLRLPLMGREIPIVLDEWVSRDFGTGAVKVTPAHDPNDFALGERHHLPSINIMDDTGHINESGGAYTGLDRYVARKRVVADLEAQGLLGAIKDHTNNVGHCDRCKTVVEPRLSTQWFIAVNKKPEDGSASMAERAIAAVKPTRTARKPSASRPSNTRRPISTGWKTSTTGASRASSGGAIAFRHGIAPHATRPLLRASIRRPARTAGQTQIVQEVDVLDTWFSSGLLPVSIFGWPEPSVICGSLSVGEHDRYPHALISMLSIPPACSITGFDILFFWVARMIMFGCWFSKDIAARRRKRAPVRGVGPVPRGIYPCAGARRKSRKDVQDQGQRRRPNRDREAVRDRCGAVHAGIDGLAWNRHRLQRCAHRGLSRLRQQNMECCAVHVHER